MTIKLYQYIYKKFIYKDLSRKHYFSLSNFQVDFYEKVQDKYKIKDLIQSPWLNDEQLREKIVSDMHFCNKIYFAFQKLYYICWKKR